MLNYCRVSVAYNFQTGNNKLKLLMQYESVIQEVLFGNVLCAKLMSWRKYNVIPQNDCIQNKAMRILKFCHGNLEINLESAYGVCHSRLLDFFGLWICKQSSILRNTTFMKQDLLPSPGERLVGTNSIGFVKSVASISDPGSKMSCSLKYQTIYKFRSPKKQVVLSICNQI
jgi:hypothetical protein